MFPISFYFKGRIADTNILYASVKSWGWLCNAIPLLCPAPLQVSVQPSTQHVDVGKSIRMVCDVRGFPVESIAWLVNGEPIANHSARILTFRDKKVSLRLYGVFM